MTKILLSTTGSEREARKIASLLVTQGLAACVNIVPSITSVYKWEEKLEESDECLLIIKSTSRRLPELIQALTRAHSYDVPEVVVLPVEGGHQPYLDWVAAETTAK